MAAIAKDGPDRIVVDSKGLVLLRKSDGSVRACSEWNNDVELFSTARTEFVERSSARNTTAVAIKMIERRIEPSHGQSSTE
jgi:hypothetical protein